MLKGGVILIGTAVMLRAQGCTTLMSLPRETCDPLAPPLQPSCTPLAPPASLVPTLTSCCAIMPPWLHGPTIISLSGPLPAQLNTASEALTVTSSQPVSTYTSSSCGGSQPEPSALKHFHDRHVAQGRRQLAPITISRYISVGTHASQPASGRSHAAQRPRRSAPGIWVWVRVRLARVSLTSAPGKRGGPQTRRDSRHRMDFLPRRGPGRQQSGRHPDRPCGASSVVPLKAAPPARTQLPAIGAALPVTLQRKGRHPSDGIDVIGRPSVAEARLRTPRGVGLREATHPCA